MTGAELLEFCERRDVKVEFWCMPYHEMLAIRMMKGEYGPETVRLVNYSQAYRCGFDLALRTMLNSMADELNPLPGEPEK